ncbi:NADH-dependent butanol dehydrogenase A [uncultured Roseburia sp.]|uniref:Iron-containing alcohol dehydrogenase n=1 Tax=Brotonthovivens ammoniilytica TaxID=2981725 RepID=A0ABT2TKA2_9FIRM|nr:iron-containing alcohol dehydrogenase [Brotonthovivens ammoniilytica]MCU6762640.1 iron-containing alcohol dehydrogenase [Brotonthovivens ammoniilytica]SCI78325.1 NADH-dependent butanol dehydrogenase A [uncultured Roseburia sp.]
MDNFVFYSPTKFVFGKGEENHAGKYVKEFGGSRVLLHFGGRSAEKSGLLDRIRESLKKEGLYIAELGGVEPNPKSGLVYKGIELCKNENIDFILAAGGGSVIDSAKAIGLGALYDGDFWDFYTGKASVEKTLPVGTVLTIAAAGSEGSDGSVITHEDGNFKRPCGSDLMRPKFSILNPELTQTLPPYQTACGITDMMAHVFERYFTNTKEVEVTDRMCEGILKAIIQEAPKVMADPDNYEARANIMWAGTMAHNDICGVGRQQDWASHNLEHELSGLYDCAHGAGLAVIFPAWMEYTLEHNVMRFAQAAVRIWGCEMNFEYPEITARAGIKALRGFWKSLGMPLNFQELGAKEEDIPKLLETLQIDGRTEGGFVPLDREACEAVYRLACR